MNGKLIFFLSLLFLISCGNGSYEIIDWYRVYQVSKLNTQTLERTFDKNVLMCKLGGGPDPYIIGVEYVEWNETDMFLKTDHGYYHVDSIRKGRLCCSCRNQVNGPYSKEELNERKTFVNFKRTKELRI